MKTRQTSWFVTAALALSLAAPFAAHAQTSGSTLTRAEVRADLARLEAAGYRPGANDRYYPSDIQAAEAKVAAAQSAAATAVGGVTAGMSDAGGRAVISTTANAGALFAHH
ncbi:DUF4148 domain-containing protein [Paraburkholderia sp.]|uniref:DUF4148 domain-containing protein n=1 Tax=Paraburkholderia sp. TaxID=1926495 RepID=UPI003D702137